MKEATEEKKRRILEIIQRLRKVYPEVKCELDYSSPMELLAATVLSAQCTDKRVNIVTPALFKKYKTISDYAKADCSDVEKLVQSTGFYKNKAKNIINAAKTIMEKFDGEVPRRLEDLVTLSGVGRKTANVVLGNAFGIPGIPVDTHMIRLNARLGISQNTDPVKIEFDLMPLVPEKDWTDYSHLIIRHGRVRCTARKPDCAGCEVQDLCPSAFCAGAGSNPLRGRKNRSGQVRQ